MALVFEETWLRRWSVVVDEIDARPIESIAIGKSDDISNKDRYWIRISSTDFTGDIVRCDLVLVVDKFRTHWTIETNHVDRHNGRLPFRIDFGFDLSIFRSQGERHAGKIRPGSFNACFIMWISSFKMFLFSFFGIVIYGTFSALLIIVITTAAYSAVIIATVMCVLLCLFFILEIAMMIA